ncbi:hypothetical protein B0H13DRAFT_1896679 [Mycena leptocephala]|nr:hypothetical protein B0H13DRAFT_1896679 [Mycena leptocephala]
MSIRDSEGSVMHTAFRGRGDRGFAYMRMDISAEADTNLCFPHVDRLYLPVPIQDDAGGRRTARDTKDQAKFPGSEPLQRHHEEPSCNGFAPCRMVVGGHHDGAWLWCTGAAPMVSIEDNEPKPEEGPTTTDQESSASQRAGSEVPVIK